MLLDILEFLRIFFFFALKKVSFVKSFVLYYLSFWSCRYHVLIWFHCFDKSFFLFSLYWDYFYYLNFKIWFVSFGWNKKFTFELYLDFWERIVIVTVGSNMPDIKNLKLSNTKRIIIKFCTKWDYSEFFSNWKKNKKYI